MKKRFLFVIGLISAFTAIGLTACGDDDEPQSCTCTEYDPDTGQTITKNLDPTTFGESSCSGLTQKLSDYDTGTSIVCH